MKKKESPRADRRRASSSVPKSTPPTVPGWTFLTNHTHVLLCLFRKPDLRLRDVAAAVGITERMVQRVVAELVEAGYLRIEKEGRCNRYTVYADLQLRHPLESQHTIGELLAVLSRNEGE
ncbi:MAG TPA: winged helix-turn-helix transcriptional regulator [Planctomycetaceae bacterium]|jgi:DNA-binding MarR family transcriptional regulator|nr:winged helix-turn-helix transcriptional regulator [Planctomycetaceae bacterium]